MAWIEFFSGIFIEEQVFKLIDKSFSRRGRHLLIGDDGKYIGLLSVDDEVKASLQQKSEELERWTRWLAWGLRELERNAVAALIPIANQLHLKWIPDFLQAASYVRLER